MFENKARQLQSDYKSRPGHCRRLAGLTALVVVALLLISGPARAEQHGKRWIEISTIIYGSGNDRIAYQMHLDFKLPERCVSRRLITLKRKGHGLIGRARTSRRSYAAVIESKVPADHSYTVVAKAKRRKHCLNLHGRQRLELHGNFH